MASARFHAQFNGPSQTRTRISVPSIAALLAENEREMSMLRTTSICTPQNMDSTSQQDAKATDALALVADPRAAEVEALKAEVARLNAELQESHGRAQKVGECERRKSEIHNVLLRTAHDEAVAAARQAREECEALRVKYDQQSNEFLAFREKARLQQQTAEADQGLLVAEVSALRAELLGARVDGAAVSVAGVHLAAMRSSLAEQDDLLAAALDALRSKVVFHHAAPRPSRRHVGAEASMREIEQWSSGATASAAAQQAGADAADPVTLAHALARLERLETMAEAATQRFSTLQDEHAALQRRYGKLQRKHAQSKETGSAAIATALTKKIVDST